MNTRGRNRGRWLLCGTAVRIAGVAALAVISVMILSSHQVGRSEEHPDLEGKESIDFEMARPQSAVPLASSALRSAVDLLERGIRPGAGLDVVDGRLRVEVFHDLDSPGIRAAVGDVGGNVEGEIKGLAQALVPFNQLVALSRHDGVRFIRPALAANIPLVGPQRAAASVQSSPSVEGEEIEKTNADDWHDAGYLGTGVRVGIVDYFGQTLWNSAQAAGEVPTAAGTFCQVDGSGCDIWSVAPGVKHGVGVAEIVHEMAPQAQLYLATVNTVTDLQAAVDYFDAQGVDVISRSLTSYYDGPGNGTGSMATVINNAVADGIAWFNSAGNSASNGAFYGQYWRHGWADADSDGWLDFAPGDEPDEAMGFYCGFANGLRWSDFGAANPTDYDVYVWDDPDLTILVGSSTDDQTSGAPPLELNIPCTTGVDYLTINLWNSGNGTSGDVLEFMTNQGALEYWQNPHSASGPASDTASAGGLSVGAVDPALGTAIAPYSSQGPTNDGLYGGTDRIKPDVSAASCVASYTYAPSCFNGTSAAAPAAAGAAALLIDAGLGATPARVKTYLLSNGMVDRGAAGPDNVFGAGELTLPPPPRGVGGTQGLPDVVASPPETSSSSSVPYAAIAGAAAGVVVLGAGGWYARRRWLS